MEGRRRPWHQQPTGGPLEARQLGGKDHSRGLSDYQPGSPQLGIRTPAGNSWTTASGTSPSGSPAFREAIKPGSSSGHRVRSDNGYSHSSDAGTGEKKKVLLEVATPLEATITVDEEDQPDIAPHGFGPTSISAMSAEPERLSSECERIVTGNRHSLHADTIEALDRLKSYNRQ